MILFWNSYSYKEKSHFYLDKIFLNKIMYLENRNHRTESRPRFYLGMKKRQKKLPSNIHVVFIIEYI